MVVLDILDYRGLWYKFVILYIWLEWIIEVLFGMKVSELYYIRYIGFSNLS